MSSVTFFSNAYSEDSLPVEISGILKAIQNGRYKDKIDPIRSITDPEEKRKAKAKLPCFTASGTFSGKKSDTIEDHSGLIAMDFDNLGDQIDNARAELYADPYTFAGFLSVSGNGLCILVKIDGKKHVDAFLALEKYYFTQYGFQADQSTKNVNRLRFVSFDPDLFYNPDSEKFDKYLPKQKGRPKKVKNFLSSEDDLNHVLNQIQQRKIDITSDYNEWINIGTGLKHEYGEAGREYFHIISQYHEGYDEQKTNYKYNSFPDKVGRGNPVAALYAVAKNHGIEIQSPKSKLIKQVATYGKKGRRTPEQVVDQLKQFDKIDPKESEDLVKKVFESPVSAVDEDEDIIGLIEEYLKRNMSIRYNEITLKYEMDGKPMTDRDYNTAYLNTKSVINKANKDLVMSVIDSDRTISINPVKEFLNKQPTPTPGHITALADCIVTTGLQSPEFVRKFVRYWIIGCVATWMKHHSPLMLVLAGAAHNTGKTHFFRYLLPDELQPYFGEAELTGEKDENLLMCSKLLILNDEMSNKSKRDISMVKKLCSVQWFNVRRPYGRSSEDVRRISGLCGTSNDLAVLSDPSGNRRVIPIGVRRIIFDAYNAIDKKALWAEAYAAYKSGERYELNSEDIAEMAEFSAEFEESSPEREGFVSYFELSAEGEPGCQFLTNTQIKAYIEIRLKQRINSRRLGMELTAMGAFKLSKKIHGQSYKVYAVKEVSGIVVSKFLETEAPF